MAFKMKQSPMKRNFGIGVSPAKQKTDPKKSKVDRMIEIEKKTDYSKWEDRSDAAKKATKNRSSIQEHQLTLKQLAKQKRAETSKAKTKYAKEKLGI